ncbi:hypothetical protein [Altererythrobacter epoxidivorans]|uniref:hypothetical protein n=1 Tax=Altererythrobacter epoxidivorans TaxID=361183 RepID=UPI000ABF0E55|nr:hypothetical protein [Altererythrobacter epoxidivorans]
MTTAVLAFRDEKQRPVKVLYIEDDLRAAAEMHELGWQEGDTVVVETDGLSGLRRAVMEVFDVVIIDRMLGDADGISLVGDFVRFGFLLQSLEPSFGKRHVRAFSQFAFLKSPRKGPPTFAARIVRDEPRF